MTHYCRSPPPSPPLPLLVYHLFALPSPAPLLPSPSLHLSSFTPASLALHKGTLAAVSPARCSKIRPHPRRLSGVGQNGGIGSRTFTSDRGSTDAFPWVLSLRLANSGIGHVRRSGACRPIMTCWGSAVHLHDTARRKWHVPLTPQIASDDSLMLVHVMSRRTEGNSSRSLRFKTLIVSGNLSKLAFICSYNCKSLFLNSNFLFKKFAW